MPIKEKNYWIETVTTPPSQSARDLPDSIDVAVVGKSRADCDGGVEIGRAHV